MEDRTKSYSTPSKKAETKGHFILLEQTYLKSSLNYPNMTFKQNLDDLSLLIPSFQTCHGQQIKEQIGFITTYLFYICIYRPD